MAVNRPRSKLELWSQTAPVRCSIISLGACSPTTSDQTQPRTLACLFALSLVAGCVGQLDYLGL
jgi:hypothetical protein